MIVRKTAAEIEIMARAGRGGGLDAGADGEQRPAPGVTTGELDAHRRGAHPLIRRRAHLQGLPRLPRFDLRVAQRHDRARHPRPLSAERRRPAVGGRRRHARRLRRPTRPSRSRSASVASRRCELIDVCQRALEAAIAQCRAGNRLGDISHAVQEVVEANGFGVVRALVGHGVGRSMHEDPQIPNYGPAGRGPKLAPGMVFAIEPMITAGSWERARRRRRLGGLHRRRQPGRPLRAHGGRSPAPSRGCSHCEQPRARWRRDDRVLVCPAGGTMYACGRFCPVAGRFPEEILR